MAGYLVSQWCKVDVLTARSWEVNGFATTQYSNHPGATAENSTHVWVQLHWVRRHFRKLD
jgi:hypothetical protein